jgi:hypothetical protein
MRDAAQVIDWNGTDVPTDDRDELVSPETEARIVAGRADVAAGRTVPWSEVDAGLGRIVAADARR